MLAIRIRDFFADPWRRAIEEQRAALASPAAYRVDREVVWVLVSTAVLLTLQHYVFRSHVVWTALDLLPSSVAEHWRSVLAATENLRLTQLTWWAVGQVFVYVLVPAIIMRRLGRSWRDYGVKRTGALAEWPVYLGMAALILPCVVAASFTAAFQQTYPFYHLPHDEPLWPRFVVWELLYIIQFLSLEFFFRGYLLHGTRRRFGPYAIFVMMVPYCMIHFGKPMLETCGAIGAGIILGFMSLKTRSIWLGAALHVAVAVTMDACALWQQGRWRQ